MRAWLVVAGVLGVASVGCRPGGTVSPPPDAADHAATPPVAEAEPKTLELHGRRFVDAYAWLRDRDDPRTRAYLDAENTFAAAVLQPLTPLHDTIVAQMRRRIVDDENDAPVTHGPFVYVTRRVAGGDYWVAERRPVAGGPTTVVLDGNRRAKGHDYYDVGGYDISPDHRRLAWGEDTRGDEHYRVFVIDIESGRALGEFDGDNGPSVAWGGDSQTLWTTRLDDANREHQLWRRRVGDDAPPVLSHQEDDVRFSVSIGRSRDERWMQLAISSGTTSEVRMMDAARPESPWRVVEPRRAGIEYEVAHHHDRLFLRTNDGATEFVVHEAKVDPKRPSGHTPWKKFAAPAADESFTGIDAFAGHLVISGRARGLSQVWVHPLDGKPAHTIVWPDAAYGASLDENPEFDTTTLRLAYSSPVTPDSTLAYTMDTRTTTVLHRDVVPDFDPASLEVERVEATADDGTKIPITIVRRRDAPRPGPLLLQGYGAYGSSWDPEFVRGDLPLLDRGVAVAIAHVRGGGELGRAWHDAGKLANKPNTFNDFIRAAEFLVQRGDTTSARLAIEGGSAGGLLVGAVVNLRPELFAAAVAEVPFVDVINTMRDASLPLTAAEWEEWGNPDVAAQLGVMADYSPYDNVGPRPYPAMLVTAGFNDPRVGYWEPAKWVARLRAQGRGRGPLLLRTEMGAGHSGSSGRYHALDDRAWVHTFVLHTIGVDR